MNRVKTLLDWPQAWILAALVLILLLDGVWSLQNQPLAGGLLVLAGVGLMLAAVAQMRRARTTVNPRGQPAALVTGGVFRLSRNPIYLGDVLVLLGVTLWLATPPGLLVVAGMVPLLTRRFILPEERRLAARFGAAFTGWCGRVRRWL